MGLGAIRKYAPRRRFDPRFRAHFHGWAGWRCKRWKRLGRKKALPQVTTVPSDNWEEPDEQA